MTQLPDWKLTLAVRAGGDEYGLEAGLKIREAGSAIDVCHDGSVYLAGQMGEAAVFGEETPTEITFPDVIVGWSDGFLARYSMDGSLEWARRIGGESEDHAYGVVASADDSAIVVGRYDSLELVLGEGEEKEICFTPNHQTNAYIAKYAKAGVLDWAVSIPSTSESISYALSVFELSDGRVLVGGMFVGTLWPFETTEISSEELNEFDGYLAWFDTNGTVLDVKRIGGDTEVYHGQRYALSGSDSVIAALPYGGAEVFGAGEGNQRTLHCESEAEACATSLARYTTDGALVWVLNVNATEVGIAAVDDDHISLIGYTSDPLSFLNDIPDPTTTEDPAYLVVANYRKEDGQLEWARFAELAFSVWGLGEPSSVGLPGGGIVGFVEFINSLSFEGEDEEKRILAAGGERDMAILGFSPLGEIRWIHRLGGDDREFPQFIAQEDGTSIWITGAYGSDPFIATSGNNDDVPLNLEGSSDVFLLRFDITTPQTE